MSLPLRVLAWPLCRALRDAGMALYREGNAMGAIRLLDLRRRILETIR